MELTDFSKINLGFLPTPLMELKNLSRELDGPKIFMKRDDQTGLAFGGSKTRKLEYLFGEALEQGCDTVITGGAQQSNHCRQTAAAASMLGIECHLALGGSKPSLPEGNLLLDVLSGAKIHYSGELRKGENIPEIRDNLLKNGRKPYVIPYGGSNVTGALGSLEAAGELKKQMEQEKISFSELVFASSSGGTQAGLMVGRKYFDASFEILGIGIDKEEMKGTSLEKYILDLANETASEFDGVSSFSQEDVRLCNDYLGEGYGKPGEPEKEAIRMVASLEGIFLDPVYTGRAMAGLIDLIRKKRYSKSESVLFWHTGGGPAIFSYRNELT